MPSLHHAEFEQELMKQSFRRPVWFVVANIFLLGVTIAFGQEAVRGPEVVAETERIVVTGSYIPTSETESALPVTVYTAEVLQKQGANTPVEGLRQLPSFVGNTARKTIPTAATDRLSLICAPSAPGTRSS